MKHVGRHAQLILDVLACDAFTVPGWWLLIALHLSVCAAAHRQSRAHSILECCNPVMLQHVSFQAVVLELPGSGLAEHAEV